MKKLHEFGFLLAVVLAVAGIAISLCGKVAVAIAEEGEREVAERPVRKAPEQRQWREKQEPRPEEKIISDEAFRLFEEAKRLEAEGKREDAAEFRAKAKRIEVEARAKSERKEAREPKEEFVSDEAFRLLREAKELEAQGRPDEAQKLIAKAKAIEAEVRARRERTEPQGEERAVRVKVLERLQGDVLAAKRKLKELSQEYGAKHPRILAAEKAVRTIKEQVQAVEAGKVKAGKGREGERVIPGELLERLHGDLFAAQRELEELNSLYGPKHPRMAAAEKKVRMIKEQIQAAEARKPKAEKGPEQQEWTAGDEVRRLLEKAERIEAEARREAQELRQKAERIEVELREKREGERRTEAAERIEGAIREHLELAERLRAEGKGDAAEEQIRKAEALKRELAERLERRPGPPPGEREPFVREKPEPEEPRVRREAPAPEFVREPRPVRPEEPRPEMEPFVRQPMPGPAFIAPQIAELRRDVNQLREELAHIRELLQQLLERQAPPLR